MESIPEKLERLKVLNDKEGKVDLLNEIAYEYHLVELIKVKEFAERALALSNQLDYLKGKAHANINLGMYHYIVGNMNEMLPHSETGYELASQIGDNKLLCSVSSNLGLYYHYFEKLDQGLKWYFKAIEYAEKNKNMGAKAYILNNIGLLFSDRVNEEKGAYYYKKAIECAESVNALRELGLATANLLIHYLNKGDLVSAKPLIKKIGVIAKQTNNKSLEAGYYMRTADYYQQDNQLQLAIAAFEKGIEICKEIGDVTKTIIIYGQLTKIYLILEELDTALKYANMGYELALLTTNLYQLKNHSSLLANIYEKKGEYKKATAYYKKNIELNRDLEREEQEKVVFEMEKKYQAEKKELENALLKSQQRENEITINAQRANNELLAKQIAFKAKLNSELERSNQDLERFAHIASHDIKAPIRTMASFAKLLKKTAFPKLNQEEKEFLAFIHKNAEKLTYLIDDLLEYSKVNSQKNKLSTVNLNQLVTELKATFLPIAKENNISISILGQFPVMLVDKIKLERVFQNLIANAIKFYDAAKESTINISCQEFADYWEFTVCDNGIGIEKTKKDIFQPFTYLNSRSSYKGTGMGLALCQRIIEQHGGTIYYESEYGAKTDFCFSIAKRIVV